jgi:cleavage and polyadenylation specificity factor subunit 1
MRLECVASWSLCAPIQSLSKVRLSQSGGRDALLLSFLDAKVSVVEYDPEVHDLKTVSLHVFEVREI